MEEINYATLKQLKEQIEHATRSVASWPLWKANEDVILDARKLVREWDEEKMNDEVLSKIVEALESIDKRLAILELRPIYSPYTSQPWGIPVEPTWEPLFQPYFTLDQNPLPPAVPCTGDPSSRSALAASRNTFASLIFVQKYPDRNASL